MPGEPTAEWLAGYRATARRRWQRDQQVLQQRQQRAWSLARQGNRMNLEFAHIIKKLSH
jgi:hypothetical protein